MKSASALGLGFGLLIAASGIWTRAATPQGPAADTIPTAAGELSIIPINHATLALRWDSKTILVDPVGDKGRYAKLQTPQVILITDIHGDHFSKETLAAVCGPDTRLVVPPAVAEQLPQDLRKQATVLSNGEHAETGVRVEAVAAYNLSPERQKFHSRGRGNGYVLSMGGKRIYISGDTEGVPEMLALNNIDVAFICMNLPYTMDVQQAAQAVLAFKPKMVYPYHYRGSDLNKFKELVGKDAAIEVRLRDWYTPEKQ